IQCSIPSADRTRDGLVLVMFRDAGLNRFARLVSMDRPNSEHLGQLPLGLLGAGLPELDEFLRFAPFSRERLFEFADASLPSDDLVVCRVERGFELRDTGP